MSTSETEYLNRNPHTGHIETIGEVEQADLVAQDRYGIRVEELDRAVREYKSSRLAALKRAIFG